MGYAFLVFVKNINLLLFEQNNTPTFNVISLILPPMIKSKIVTSVLICFATVLLFSCGDKDSDVKFTTSRPMPKLSYHLAQKNNLPYQLTVPGQLMPYEQITLFSEISGYVDEILFEEGESVAKNQALLRIDSDRTVADIHQIEVDLTLAKREYDRQKALSEANATSTEQLEQTESRVAQLEAQLQRLQIEIDKSTIKAPFDGVMGLRQISKGAFVTSSQPISTLAQTATLKVEFAVPQRYATELQINDTIEVVEVNTGEKHKAILYAKEPFIDPTTKTLTVRARLKSAPSLYPGAFVNVVLSLPAPKDGMIVPTEAVMPVLNGHLVWVKRNNKATSETVELGMRTEKDIVINGNINEGDTILITGLLGLSEGMKVEVVED